MSSKTNRLVIFAPTLKALDASIPLVCGFCRQPNHDVQIVLTNPALESFSSDANPQVDIRIQFLKTIERVKILAFSQFVGKSQQSLEGALPGAFELLMQSASENGATYKFIFSTSANPIEIYLAAAAHLHGIKNVLYADSMFPIHPSNRRILDGSADVRAHPIGAKDFSLFDDIILPHSNAFEALGGSLPVSRVKLAGAARYSNEWITSWMQLCGGAPPMRPDDSLSVTFLLRPHTDGVFWKEIVRTVQLLRTLYNASCTIQIHVEDAFLTMEELGQHYSWLQEINGQVTIQPGTTPSIYSIARSDLVIDTATSSAFEAFTLGIPVLQFKYLQAYRPLLSDLYPRMSFKCRDDIVAYLNPSRRPPSPLSGEDREGIAGLAMSNQSLSTIADTIVSL